MSEARQQILTTAGELFAARGYELVGINEIIEKSGVAKATFYAHFKSKEKLCAEWLRARAADYARDHERILASDSSALDKVKKKFDSLRRYVKDSDFRGCSFSTTASMLAPGTEVRDVIRDYKASARVFWQGIARERVSQPARARALGDALFLLYSGALTEAQNARDLWPVESAKAAAIALFEATS